MYEYEDDAEDLITVMKDVRSSLRNIEDTLAELLDVTRSTDYTLDVQQIRGVLDEFSRNFS